jgi:long-chain acyl-CoA synthetase
VELTIAGIELFCENVRQRLRLKPGERSLMLLPIQHIFGLTSAYAMLSAGVALGVCPDYRRLYDAAERFQADFIFTVPALADILAQKIERRSHICGADLPNIKWICSGGAPLSPRTHERLSALGIKVLMAYGLTETTALYSLSDFSREAPVGSAGEVCAIEGVETKVSDSGELMIRGPNVFKGYFKDRERTCSVKDRDGWFRTGDVGRIDADGRVWITGRLSRTIVLSSGKKVAPEELETKILMYPGINEVVVSGEGKSRELTAEIYSEMPVAEVHGVISALNSSLPVYMRIKRVICRTKPFARTASGKISLSQANKGTRRRPWLKLFGLFMLGVVAISAALIGLVSREMILDNPTASDWQRLLVSISDMVGEILLGIFAFALISVASRHLLARRKDK